MSLPDGKTLDSCHEEIARQLQSTGKVRDISDEFFRLKSDQSRAAFTLNLQVVNDVIRLQNPPTAKSKADALKFKDLGNKQFQTGSYDEAIKLYTKSIAYAPLEKNSGSTLSLGYANRSAALYHKGAYKLVLLDVGRALANHYPEEMCYKLYERKGKCHRHLGHYKAAVENFEQALSALSSAKLNEKKLDAWQKDLARQLEECKSDAVGEELSELNLSEKALCEENSTALPSFTEPVHRVFPSLSASCDVDFTEHQGRFIVAKRDMAPGEIVLIEKPFASVLLLQHSLNYCHHCFNRVIAPIPSARSCLVIFCSERCKTSAESYHQFEWPSLDLMLKSGVGKFGYLALRTVATCGPEFLRNFQRELQTSSDAKSKLLLGTNKNGKYAPDDFNTIYNLVTHASDRSGQDLFRRSVTAVFLLKCLEKGGFFAAKDGADFREFVGGLLLSHLQSFPCNAHEIPELELRRNDIANSLPVEIGAGIYSTLSLFNHSCDPVVNRNFYGDTCVVRTIKLVRKGEEISDNYGAVYPVHSLQERNNILLPQYYFRCACQACIENWPLYPEINCETPLWKCEDCQCPLPATEIRKGESSVQCAKCKRDEDIGQKMQELKKSSKRYRFAFDDLLKGDVAKALPVFVAHLGILDRILCRPWREFNDCQEAIKQCFSMMANHRVVSFV